MKKYKDDIISIILSIILVIFIWHNFLVSGNNVIFIFIFVACYIALKKILSKLNKRSGIVAAIIAILFALVEVICKSINTDYTLNHIINKWLIVNLSGYFIIAWAVILCMFDIFENNKLNNKQIKIFGKEIFTSNTLSVIICAVLILIAWTPYFLRYYPGIVTSDSYSQIEQTIGKIDLQDHHPITHTAIIGIFINLGLLIFKNINTGIALYSLASMVIMAILDSLVLRYLSKKKVPAPVRIIILLYYMFYPINATYSVTMWKDVIFSGLVPIFLILCMELIFNTDEFFSKKRNVVIYIIVALFTILLRHNGLYAVILTLPFILIVLRKHWKKVLPLFIGVVVAYELSNILIFNILKISKVSVGEMLSIPLQQIARVEKYHKEELDENTITQINNFFVVENIGEQYTPTLSDNVKFKFNTEYFNENKSELINLWLKLLIKYPKDYVESFISNSYGYYYPEAFNTAVIRVTLDHDMGIEQSPKIEGKLVDKLNDLTETRGIPVFSMIFSIGAGFWLTIICLGYKIYKKEYRYILVYLPTLILWLTCVASPAFCEFRYAYPIFTTLPIFISMNFINKENNEKSEN